MSWGIGLDSKMAELKGMFTSSKLESEREVEKEIADFCL